MYFIHRSNSSNHQMKKLLTQSRTVLLLLAGIIMFSSCAKKIMFGSSAVVPAAVGSVKIKSDKNNNQTIDISINNLAPSDKLTPPKKTYVVWMVTENNGTKNIGQLNSSSGMLSSALKANLKTVSSFKPSSFFITAEDDGNVQYPASAIVLTTAN